MAVPKFRFPGFTGDWEQRKALDIADYSKGNGYSKSDLTENGTPIILYGRLYTKYQFAIDEVDTFATPKDGSIYSQGNEVIIPASGETAEDIARASAVEKSGILLGGDLNILRPFNFINPLFLALTISNGEPQKELAKKAQGKSVVHIHNSDIQKVTVSFPTRAEQDQIVAVFRSLDNLITLHHRKYGELQDLKKSMIQNMFPKEGKKVPEIRFPGFTGDWEQRKLSDAIVDIADGPFGSNLKAVHYTDEKEARIIQLSNLSDYGWQEPNTRYTTFEHAKEIRRCIVNEGELVMGKMMPAGMTIIRPNTEKMYVLSSDCVRIKLDKNVVTDEFFLYTTKSEAFLNQVNNDSQGSTRVRTSISKIREMDFATPSLEEQAKIGEYFTNLDNLITLHHRKCDELKELKKGLLQQLFC